MKNFVEIYQSHYSSHNEKIVAYDGLGEHIEPRRMSQWGSAVEEALCTLSKENLDTVSLVTRLAEVIDERDKTIVDLVNSNNKMSDRIDSLVSTVKYLDQRLKDLESSK